MGKMDRARELLALGKLRHLALPDRGVDIGLLDWGGQGPPALLHHANGFCKGVLGLLVPELRKHFRVFAMDARGHGDSTWLESSDAYQWDEFALDVLAVAERLESELGEPLALGLGHSFGGTSLLGAASRRPDVFKRLVLVDPVTPPKSEDAPPERLAMTAELAERAERRRSDWPDRDEARDWWAERPLFEHWQQEAIDLYALDGLRDRSDGTVELKCRGSVESAVFRSGGSIDVAAILKGLPTPTLWLAADRGNFPLDVATRLAGTMAAGQIQRVDAGHLVPMERPDLVTEASLRFLETT